MKVKDLIEKLKEFNPEAETFVNVHCLKEYFSLSWSNGEGVTKENCKDVSFYVDRLSHPELVSGEVAQTHKEKEKP